MGSGCSERTLAESCRLWGVPEIAVLSPNICLQDLGGLRINLMAAGQR